MRCGLICLDHRLACRLKFLKRILNTLFLSKAIKKRNRIFERNFVLSQLRVCRVQRIAQQHYIFKKPVRVFHQQEIDPLGIVGKQRLFRQIAFNTLSRY